MNRRHCLGALALSAFAKPAGLRVNAARLREHLEALSVFGRPSGGGFADGVSRVAYSDADLAGRRYTMGLMEAAGLKPRIDAAGNIFARRAGSDPAQPPVLFGSHIDSVPSGGNFDLDGSQRSDVAVEVAAAGDGIDVGAEENGGLGRVGAGAPGEDVSGGIDARLQTGGFHQSHGVAPTSEVGIGIGHAAHSVGEPATGWAAEYAEGFEMFPQAGGIHAEACGFRESRERQSSQAVSSVHGSIVTQVWDGWPGVWAGF